MIRCANCQSRSVIAQTDRHSMPISSQSIKIPSNLSPRVTDDIKDAYMSLFIVMKVRRNGNTASVKVHGDGISCSVKVGTGRGKNFVSNGFPSNGGLEVTMTVGVEATGLKVGKKFFLLVV